MNAKLRRALTLLLLLSLFCAICFASLEAVHDCHGEESCPICRIIAVLSAVLGVCAVFLLGWVFFLTEKRRRVAPRVRERSVTLVALKVKLTS